MSSALLPPRVVDCHHHFFEPATDGCHSLIAKFGAPAYTAQQYKSDCSGVAVTRSVHVEAGPSDCGEAVREVAYVEARASECGVGAIVAACDLAAEDCAERLDKLKAASALVRGVRWILDVDGAAFDGSCATHAFCARHGQDYLRSPPALALFERGFGLLATRGFSFDLQCAPAQLVAAAALCARHPFVPVALCHLGKPRHLLLQDVDEARDAAELATWRLGMQAMAKLPQVCVKLSMIGYAVPGWSASPHKEQLARDLVRETIALFGAERCMFASNWHVNAQVSDSDGRSEPSPSIPELYAAFQRWVADLSQEDQDRLFAGTAEQFYKL